MDSMDTIALVEELAANAVPAAIIQDIDGWRLRFNGGVTRRANSVLAVSAGSRYIFQERIGFVEDFYWRRGLPARFQITPASRPSDLEERLIARGYTASQAAYVQMGQISIGPMEYTGQVVVSEQFDDAWLAAYVAGEGEQTPHKIATRRTMLQHIAPATGFVSLTLDGQMAAVALGVVEREWLGIFSVATNPAYRRRGLAKQALHGLMTWAQQQGARYAYLQVDSRNQAALPLYAGLGFATLYQYIYRERERP